MEAEPDELRAQVAFLRAWVDGYRHEGGEQWYVDEYVVDVDADIFWLVLEHGMRLWHSRVPLAPLEVPVAPDTRYVASDTCACGHARNNHGSMTVDTMSACLECGCWAFTTQLALPSVPQAPVAPNGIPRHP